MKNTRKVFVRFVRGQPISMAQMNSCIWQFRAYEEESLDYLHVREGLVEDSPLVGGWDSSVSKKDAYESLR